MADRVHIPNSPACGQWETLLADALDGLLKPEDEGTFTSHMATCATCSALFEESRRGREWLGYLAEAPEVPAGLLEKILARTGPGHASGYELATGGGKVVQMVPAWQRPGMMGFIRRFAEPRLLMTAAMAFFSIALTFSLTGLRLSDLTISNLRPSVVRSFMERRLTTASTPIIRYYDHLRLVYEVESRMRELRRSSQGELNDDQQQNNARPAAPGESKKSGPHKDGGSRVNRPPESAAPSLGESTDSSEYLETSLKLHDRPAHSGGSVMARRERSTVWTA